MYKIGLIGHESNVFSDKNHIIATVENTISLLKYQYDNDVVFNICGDVGIGEWTGRFCIDNNIKYRLFMPLSLEIMEKQWNDEQTTSMKDVYNNSYSVVIGRNKYCDEAKMEIMKNIVDESCFVICFWVKKHIGITYETIKYAMSQSKLVINALEDLKLVTKHDILTKRIFYGRKQ